VTKVLTARVPDELADWAEGYARERGVTRQALIEMALADFRESCRGGWPMIVWVSWPGFEVAR
jgi:predicted transcriptional regulator